MDFNAEPLTDDFSDARTDAAGYDVYLEGQVHQNMLASYEYTGQSQSLIVTVTFKEKD